MTTITSTFRASKLLLGSVSGVAILMAFTPMASAQIVIDDAQTAPVETNGQDVTIDSEGTNDGSITLTGPGPAIILNSNNDVTQGGAITINDVNDAVGVSLEGGADRNYTQSGSISLTEDFTNTDTDGDNVADGPFAEGSGRTGILISGASPFEGNIELASTSSIDVEGNDSFGINLSNTTMAQEGLTGNLSYDGTISVLGDNATGINIGSGISGDFVQNGSISTTGEGAQGINIDADIQGGFVSSGAVTNTGFRIATRPGLSNPNTGAAGRDTLGLEDLLQASSAVNISGNIGRGVFIDDNIDDGVDTDGNPIQTAGTAGTIIQNGSAPAILIDGGGTPIAIGRVAAITDPPEPGRSTICLCQSRHLASKRRF